MRPHNPIPSILFRAGMNQTEVKAATGLCAPVVASHWREYLKQRTSEVREIGQRLAASGLSARCSE
jgi:hypothetical protein